MNLGSLAEDWSARTSRITNHVKATNESHDEEAVTRGKDERVDLSCNVGG